jgi:hypothetical protein
MRIDESATTAIHDPLGLKCHSLDQVNEIADCLEKQFTFHDLCDEIHAQWLEAKS